VYGNGGAIAKKEGGKWKGTLSEPAAIEGLKKWVELAKTYSKGDPTKDENDIAAVAGQGSVGMYYANGWELGAAESAPKDPNDPKSARVDTVVKGKLAAIPLPGFTADKGMPSFLGGSVVGVTDKSQNKGLAAEWIKDFTGTTAQQGLIAKGALPNATSLLDEAAKVKGNEATALAAKNSWFTPSAPGWAGVEKGKLLQQMLVDLLTGTKPIDEVVKDADAKITTALNAS
jgi:N,N'-diacetylchitobiose transport system substrate-binding protein